MTGSIVVAATIALTVAGYFISRKIILRPRQKRETNLTEEQRKAVGYALEVFQPFHWETLHFAILSQEFRKKVSSAIEEHNPEKTELLNAYSSAYSSIQNELENLNRKLDANEIRDVQAMLPVNLREEALKVVQTLGEACRLAQEQGDLKECFNLVEIAYRDCSQVEKALRSLYRRSS